MKKNNFLRLLIVFCLVFSGFAGFASKAWALECDIDYSCQEGEECIGGICYNEDGEPVSGIGSQDYVVSDYRVLNTNEFAKAAFSDSPAFESFSFASFNNLTQTGSVSILGVSDEVAMELPMLMKGQSSSGAVGTLASGISYMVGKPPANTVEYIADIGRDAGFVKQAYADNGMGWNSLNSVMNLWKAFRNIAYMAFIVIFIVIGFMIMFRSKIGGQALVTIQTSLPNIVVTLLLITFSYAIASLVIDLIYVSIYLLIGVFSSVGIIDNASDTINAFFDKNVIVLGWQSIWGNSDISKTAASAVGDIIENAINKDFWGGLLGGIGGGLATLIFAVALLIAVFKVFFQLLMAYIGIIVQVIFAPILLLANALPGSKSFINWLKNIVANALIFPVVAVMFILAAALSGSQGNEIGVLVEDTATTSSFQIPFLNYTNASAFSALIGFGILMMMPKVVEMVQKALKVESPLGDASAGAMETIGAGWNKVNAPFRAAGGFGKAAVGGAATLAGQGMARKVRGWFPSRKITSGTHPTGNPEVDSETPLADPGSDSQSGISQ